MTTMGLKMLLTSSEVELMETQKNSTFLNKNLTLLTSSEVELMETGVSAQYC